MTLLANLTRYVAKQVCTDTPSSLNGTQKSNYWGLSVPICAPASVLSLNVSYETALVSLQPGLRYPEIQDLRVEVAGQVLSQGGNVGADQIVDTSDQQTERYSIHEQSCNTLPSSWYHLAIAAMLDSFDGLMH